MTALNEIHKPNTGPIPPLPDLSAPADIMADARANCAARYRARGQDAEAEAFARGERDQAWALRHEIYRLRAEREAFHGQ